MGRSEKRLSPYARTGRQTPREVLPIVSRQLKSWLRGRATVNTDGNVHRRGLNGAPMNTAAGQELTSEYEVN